MNGTADRAFVSLHADEARRSLDEVLERAYRVDLRLRTRADLAETEPWPRRRAPGPDASLVNETVDRAATIESGPAALPARADGWTRFRTATRRVTVTHEITWTWVRDGETIRTSTTVTERYRIGIAVDGRTARINGTPERPIVPVFERGGALDGPNLADVPNESDAFLTERGGVDSIAARRATDGPDALDRNASVTGTRPDELRRWVSADLVGLQREVRNLSTVVRMGDAATGRSNPAARLASTLADRRAALVDAPEQYDGAADRARVAARTAYLDRVHTRLTDRGNATRQANGRLVDQLREKGIDLPGRASDVMANRTATQSDSPPVAGPLGGEDVFVPQGGPAYLDVQGVDGTDAAWTAETETVYPLETRNLNVFTVPYVDAAEAVVGSSGSKQVRLHTAALTLRAAENAGNGSERLRKRRAHLRTGIDSALTHVEDRTRDVLAEETSLGPQERRQAVDTALARWNRTSAKALAVTNGSFVPRVVDASGVEASKADRLGIHLRVAVAEARESSETGVSRRRVNDTATTVRRVSTTVATEAIGTVVANGTERLVKRAKGKAVILPAGLPLLPTPTNWYVTVNVWEVRVQGEYPRFAVRTRRGVPGETVTYVRDGGVARVDVDGDGTGEELGRADRVDFSVRTVILVAVPPGKIGVGDTDGQMIEESPGWGSDDENDKIDENVARTDQSE